MALTTLFQSSLNSAGVVMCASKAAQYILPNISADIQQILVERLHTAIIRCISKYYSANQEICCDLLRHVLPQLWKMNSSLCKNAITDAVFVELLTAKLSVLVEDDNHIHAMLPYVVLLSKHIEYWKSIIPDMESAGVHRTIRTIFRSYSLLSVEELCGILKLLCSFVGYGTQTTAAHVNQYVSEDMHTHLIIMIQEFVLNLTVQELAWKLIKLLCRYQEQFAYALMDKGLLHCASSFLMEHNAMESKQYAIDILNIIIMSNDEFCTHFFQVPGLVESIAQLMKNDTLEEQYMFMASYIICELTTKMPMLLVPKILNLDVLRTMKQRALQSIQCPKKYTLLVCQTLNNIMSCGKSIEFDKSELNIVFQNNHLFYQEVLSNGFITSNAKLTTFILKSLNQFIRGFPRDLLDGSLCTNSFIEPLLLLFQTCKDSVVIFSITSLLASFFYLLCNCRNGPKVVYECDAHVALAKAFTKSLTISIAEELLKVFRCLLILYYKNKTTATLFDVSLHKLVIDVAKKFGHLQCQKLADIYDRYITAITNNKEFSKKLVSLNYMDDLTPLISDTYSAPIFKASLSALGNLAICGAEVKVKLINEDELHLRIISYIREHTIDGNAGVLSACCRVLHILASGDRAKRLFIDVGCIEVLLRLLELRRDDSEICWRSLGTLSSLGFTALCNHLDSRHCAIVIHSFITMFLKLCVV